MHADRPVERALGGRPVRLLCKSGASSCRGGGLRNKRAASGVWLLMRATLVYIIFPIYNMCYLDCAQLARFALTTRRQVTPVEPFKTFEKPLGTPARGWTALCLLAWMLAVTACSEIPAGVDASSEMQSRQASGRTYTSPFRLDALPQHFDDKFGVSAEQFQLLWERTQLLRGRPILYGLEGEVPVEALQAGRQALLATSRDALLARVRPMSDPLQLTRGFYDLYRIPTLSDEQWAALDDIARAEAHASSAIAWQDMEAVRVAPGDLSVDREARSVLSRNLKLETISQRVEITTQRGLVSLRRLREFQAFLRDRCGAYAGFHYHISFALGPSYSEYTAFALANFWTLSNEFAFTAYLADSPGYALTALTEKVANEASPIPFWGRPPDISRVQSLVGYLIDHRSNPSRLAGAEASNYAGHDTVFKYAAVGFRFGIYAAEAIEPDRVGLEMRLFASDGFDEPAIWYLANAMWFVRQLGGSLTEVRMKFGPNGDPYSALDLGVHDGEPPGAQRLDALLLRTASERLVFGALVWLPGRDPRDPRTLFFQVPEYRFDRRRELKGCQLAIRTARGLFDSCSGRRWPTDVRLMASVLTNWARTSSLAECL